MEREREREGGWERPYLLFNKKYEPISVLTVGFFKKLACGMSIQMRHKNVFSSLPYVRIRYDKCDCVPCEIVHIKTGNGKT